MRKNLKEARLAAGVGCGQYHPGGYVAIFNTGTANGAESILIVRYYAISRAWENI